MEKMSVDEVVLELKERIEDLRPYIAEVDDDSEYFQGVQEGYILAVAMLTGEMIEGTILPYQQL
jgi:hypothetical protein